MSPEALLRKHGVELDDWGGPPLHDCPKCSYDRKSAAHRSDKVLGVTIEADGSVRFGCNHCDWTGPEKGKGNGADGPPLIDYVYRDKTGAPQFRKVRNAPGRQPRFWLEKWDGLRWVKGTKGVDTSILYRADEVAQAIEDSRIVLCVEGEKDVDNCRRIGFAATCNAHGASEPGKAAKWTKSHSEQLKGADIIVVNDNDAPGYAHAEATCKLSVGKAKRVRRLDLKVRWPEIPEGGDVSDWLAEGHTREELGALIAAAPEYAAEDRPPPGQQEGDDAELTRLARMPLMEYERARAEAAKRLRCRAAMLDRIITSKRTELGLADDSLQGVAVEFAEIEPWPKAVGGTQVLDEIANALRRHVVLSDDARDACALWITHTHLIERFRISPKLSLRSPTRNCGKSTLLEVIAPMVRRPLLASNITPAALFRVVQKHRPTLLIDEVDSFLRDNDEVRGLLNASHRHDGQIIRTVGDDHEPRAFRVYAAVALSGIGALPPTVADRSIDIELKRRLRGEALEELRAGETAHLDEIARRLARWVADNADWVAAVRPQMPDGLVNRLADNWAPLLAIADLVGGDWPKRARKAAAKAATNVDASEENRIELALADIRTVFDQEAEGCGRRPDGDDRIASDDLVERMVALEGRPWAEYSRSGKPMTKNALARLLDKIHVSPQVVRIEDRTPRGYCRRQFEEAWDRYLSHHGSSNRNTATNPGKPGQSGQFATATKEKPVAVSNPRSPVDNVGLLRCCGREEGDGAAPVCAQCHGPPDGTEQLVAIGDETVPLHPECVRFFVKRRGQA